LRHAFVDLRLVRGHEPKIKSHTIDHASRSFEQLPEQKQHCEKATRLKKNKGLETYIASPQLCRTDFFLSKLYFVAPEGQFLSFFFKLFSSLIDSIQHDLQQSETQ